MVLYVHNYVCLDLLSILLSMFVNLQSLYIMDKYDKH